MAKARLRVIDEDKTDCICIRARQEELARAISNLDSALHMLLGNTEYDVCPPNVQEFIDVLEELHDRARRCTMYNEPYIWVPQDAVQVWQDAVNMC